MSDVVMPAKRKRASRTREQHSATTVTPSPPLDADRQLLRDVAALCARADAELMASLVTEVDDTLMRCGVIDAFLRRYVAALRSKVVH